MGNREELGRKLESASIGKLGGIGDYMPITTSYNGLPKMDTSSPTTINFAPFGHNILLQLHYL